MAISTTGSQALYTGTNSPNQICPFPYIFFANSDLEVVTLDASNVSRTLVLGTDYSVTGANNVLGGSVTLFLAVPTTTTISIVRNNPETQLVSLTTGDRFPASIMERALDKLTMLCQELGRAVSKTLRVADVSSSQPVLTPVPTSVITTDTSNQFQFSSTSSATGDAPFFLAATTRGGQPTFQSIPTGAIGSTQIAAGAVGSAKLATGSVGSIQLATGSVIAEKISTGAVGSNQLATGSVGETKLATGAVTSDKLASGAVGSTQLADASVTSAKIATGAVGTTQLADASVTSAKIATSAVGTTQLVDASVTSAKIATSAVGTTQLATGAVISEKLATGAVATAQLATGAVTSDKILAEAVTGGKLATGAVGATQLADASVTSAKIATGAVGTTQLADASVTSAKIADSFVTTNTRQTITGEKVIQSLYETTSTTPIPGTLAVRSFIVGTGLNWKSGNQIQLSVNGSSTLRLRGVVLSYDSTTGAMSANIISSNISFSTHSNWIVTQWTGSVPALRITSNDSAPAFLVEDSTNPDSTPFTISSTGRVGIGIAPDTTSCLALDSTGLKFSDGTIQTTAPIQGVQNGGGIPIVIEVTEAEYAALTPDQVDQTATYIVNSTATQNATNYQGKEFGDSKPVSFLTQPVVIGNGNRISSSLSPGSIDYVQAYGNNFVFTTNLTPAAIFNGTITKANGVITGGTNSSGGQQVGQVTLNSATKGGGIYDSTTAFIPDEKDSPFTFFGRIININPTTGASSVAWDFNTSTPAVSRADIASQFWFPQDCIVDAANNKLFVSSAFTSSNAEGSSIARFSIDPTTKALTPDSWVKAVTPNGSSISYIFRMVLLPDGYIFVSNYNFSILTPAFQVFNAYGASAGSAANVGISFAAGNPVQGAAFKLDTTAPSGIGYLLLSPRAGSEAGKIYAYDYQGAGVFNTTATDSADLTTIAKNAGLWSNSFKLEIGSLSVTSDGAIICGIRNTATTPIARCVIAFNWVPYSKSGTLSAQNANNVAISGGSITGVRNIAPKVEYINSSRIWYRDELAKYIRVQAWGGGGGGGSGRKDSSATVVRSGGGGGGGGGYIDVTFDASLIATAQTEVSIFIGAGGFGGTSQTTNGTNGNSGLAGGVTSFAVGSFLIRGSGGGGGGGGSNASATGGAPSVQAAAGGASSATGGSGSQGLPIGSSSSTITIGQGGAGGGAGGGLTTANATSGGGAGGNAVTVASGGIVGGVANGGAGNAGIVPLSWTAGGGGSGGGSNTAGDGGAGGVGGPASGGGGGGSTQNGNSGAGGNGGNGFMVITTFY